MRLQRSVVCVLLSLLIVVSGSIGNLRPVAGALPPTNMLSVPYHSQGESLSVNGYEYCGVASLQMVLQYISGQVTSQLTLATQLGTDYDSGSYPLKMKFQFWNSGYSKVDLVTGDVVGLKQLNSQGFASIILIWFDTTHQTGHYVVVTGYNETGIFVNDPWPLRWSQSKDRMSGPNAYISISMLTDLWSYNTQSMLIVPYPAYASSSTTTSQMVLVAGERASSIKWLDRSWD